MVLSPNRPSSNSSNHSSKSVMKRNKKDVLETDLKVITYGSDFSGLSSQSVTLNSLRTTYGLSPLVVHKFACDKYKPSRKLIQHLSAPEKFYPDICSRSIDETPTVDFYQYTSPCQGISQAGKQQPDDPRTLVMTYSVLYVRKRRPKCFVSEQVGLFGTSPKFKKLHDFIIDEHKKDGYIVHERVVNSKSFGVPQNRNRWYLVGFRSDCYRARSCGVDVWPSQVARPLPFTSIVTNVSEAEWKPHPVRGTPACENVMNAYRKHKQNPFITPMVIDVGSSVGKFDSVGVGLAPTLTKTRCASGGYWCSTKGGLLTTDELASLQGWSDHFGTKIDWREAGLTSGQMGSLIGNAQSGNFLLLLYPRVLFLAQLLTMKEYLTVQRNLDAKFNNLGSSSVFATVDGSATDVAASSSSSNGSRWSSPSAAPPASK
jgi:hypothetical protein